MRGVDWMRRSVIWNRAGRRCRKMKGAAANLGWVIRRRGEGLRRRESSKGSFAAERSRGSFASEKSRGSFAAKMREGKCRGGGGRLGQAKMREGRGFR
ncbi:hypothetical protein MRB53_011753 [Persea americana]|uniref:Uncharacterized protein n=1 Tax=Persea americana TaxID=3435 RepID=A0ACC2LVU0_PERAE|nr:hypothetical protein MRB53_011753 [Persea americana]